MLIIEPEEGFQSKSCPLVPHSSTHTAGVLWCCSGDPKLISDTEPQKKVTGSSALTLPQELSLASEITSFHGLCHYTRVTTLMQGAKTHQYEPPQFTSEHYFTSEGSFIPYGSHPPKCCSSQLRIYSPPQTSFSDFFFLILKLALKSLSTGGFGGYHPSITRLIALNAGRGCQPGEVPGSLPEPLHSILFVTPIKHVGH